MSTTEDAKPILDINWMSLVTGGLKGAATSAAKWGLSWALNSVFGIQVGAEKKKAEKQQLVDTLNAVQSEMTSMAQSLTNISSQLDSLGAELDIDTQEIKIAIGELEVNNAVAKIQTHWGDLVTMVGNCITDVSKVNDGQTVDAAQTAPSGQSGAPAQTDQTLSFANNVIGAWDIPTALTDIGNALLPGSESDEAGLLSQWTNLLITKINDEVQAGKPAQVLSAYLTLEQNFLGALQYLYQGFGLVLNAKLRISLEDNNANPNCMAIMQTDGASYLSSSAVAGLLKQLTEQFLLCAHQIVLSQYMLPLTNSPSFAPFTSQSDANTAIGRATLMCWLINNDNAGTSPGICVARYLRPSQLSGGAAPSLTPSGYPASSGQVVGLNQAQKGAVRKELKSWFKVVDYQDAACTQILSYADSNVQIANYQWSSPPPAAGTTVPIAGLPSGVTPQYYSTQTLTDKDATGAPVTPGENAVMFGFFIDMSGITDNLLWSTASSWTVTSSPSPSGKDSQYIYWKVTPANTSSPPRSTQGAINITGQFKGDETTLNTTLGRSLSYVGNGADSPSLAFCFSGGITIAGMNSTANSAAAVPFTISGEGTIGSIPINGSSCSVTTPGKKGGPTWTQENSNASSSLTLVQSVSVSSGQKLDLQFTCTCTALEQSSLEDYDGNLGQGAGNGTATVNMATIAWPQPRPAPLPKVAAAS
jgi:hypothetical protein